MYADLRERAGRRTDSRRKDRNRSWRRQSNGARARWSIGGRGRARCADIGRPQSRRPKMPRQCEGHERQERCIMYPCIDASRLPDRQTGQHASWTLGWNTLSNRTCTWGTSRRRGPDMTFGKHRVTGRVSKNPVRQWEGKEVPICVALADGKRSIGVKRV
ncbi:hypothetical protein LZ31DRAFT_236618 [Colletotrichum somersetense]|nr:hypothetical protein LZ31DRAFT_236618 [Colletotrichum somersetense]